MRARWLTAMAVCSIFGLGATSFAQDDAARGIVDRALRALGGEERFAKQQAGRVKTKGRLELFGGVDMTQDIAYQMPDKFRQQLGMQVNGQQVNVLIVYDGKKAALEVNGQKVPSDDKLTDAMKEAAYQMHVGRLVGLKHKDFELSGVGEIQVNGKAAQGVRVAKKGQTDINIYFDKQTSLPLKLETRTRDFMSGQEVTEERILTEYQMLDGVPVPSKIEIIRDGKHFMDAEVVEARFLEKIDDSEFAVP